MTNTRTYRPNELASELDISPKLLRNYLRANFTRPVEQKNVAWHIDADVAKLAREYFAARRTTT